MPKVIRVCSLKIDRARALSIYCTRIKNGILRREDSSISSNGGDNEDELL